jgi:hypothetical protein
MDGLLMADAILPKWSKRLMTEVKYHGGFSKGMKHVSI